MFLRPRTETLVILEALGIHCAPLKSYFLSPQSHLFYKAVCAIYAHTHIYIHTHAYMCMHTYRHIVSSSCDWQECNRCQNKCLCDSPENSEEQP